jgi:hypothetical protein
MMNMFSALLDKGVICTILIIGTVPSELTVLQYVTIFVWHPNFYLIVH